MNEVDRNYASFADRLDELLAKHPGEFALMHDRSIVQFYRDGLAAYRAGLDRYGEGGFSVEEVTDEVEDMGFISYVGGPLLA